jgi:hypothetical protein
VLVVSQARTHRVVEGTTGDSFLKDQSHKVAVVNRRQNRSKSSCHCEQRPDQVLAALALAAAASAVRKNASRLVACGIF